MSDIKDIDARIAVLEQELASLRRRRNEFSSIRRLPTELVVRLFKLLVPRIPQMKSQRQQSELDWYQEDYMSSIFRFVQPETEARWVQKSLGMDWVRFMSTCVWLREIALSTRELWQLQGISVTSSLEWRNLCLERLGRPAAASTMIQCQIDPNMNVSKVSDSLEVLKVYLTMAEEAYISFLPEALVDDDECDPNFEGAWHDVMCYSSLTTSCPRLKYLNISWNRLEIDREFLGGRSTTLTTLVLSHFDHINSTWPQLPSLHNLLLDYNETSTEDYEAETSCLLGWMRTLLSLEILSVRCTSTRLWNDLDDYQITVIPLPYLRAVRLEAHPNVVACILRSLPDPSIGMDIAFLFNSEDASSYYDMVLKRLHQFWYQNLEVTTPSSLHVQMFIPTRVDVDCVHREVGSMSIRSHSDRENIDITQRFCLFSGGYRPGSSSIPFVIDVLHFDDRSISKSISLTDCFDVSLDNVRLQTVKWDLSKPYGHGDILRLEEWLKERRDCGNPIRRLQICKQASDEVTGWLQEMAHKLTKSKIVEEVNWKVH